VFWFSLKILPETFFILWRTERDTIKNVYWYSCKFPLFLSYINESWIFSTDFPKILTYATQIPHKAAWYRTKVSASRGWQTNRLIPSMAQGQDQWRKFGISGAEPSGLLLSSITCYKTNGRTALGTDSAILQFLGGLRPSGMCKNAAAVGVDW
jgi:hypothetical protein